MREYLEVGSECSEKDERAGTCEVQKANHKAFHHELIARLRIKEHDLSRLRIGIVPKKMISNAS